MKVFKNQLINVTILSAIFYEIYRLSMMGDAYVIEIFKCLGIDVTLSESLSWIMNIENVWSYVDQVRNNTFYLFETVVLRDYKPRSKLSKVLSGRRYVRDSFTTILPGNPITDMLVTNNAMSGNNVGGYGGGAPFVGSDLPNSMATYCGSTSYSAGWSRFLEDNDNEKVPVVLTWAETNSTSLRCSNNTSTKMSGRWCGIRSDLSGSLTLKGFECYRVVNYAGTTVTPNYVIGLVVLQRLKRINGVHGYCKGNGETFTGEAMAWKYYTPMQVGNLSDGYSGFDWELYYPNVDIINYDWYLTIIYCNNDATQGYFILPTSFQWSHNYGGTVYNTASCLLPSRMSAKMFVGEYKTLKTICNGSLTEVVDVISYLCQGVKDSGRQDDLLRWAREDESLLNYIEELKSFDQEGIETSVYNLLRSTDLSKKEMFLKLAELHNLFYFIL